MTFPFISSCLAVFVGKEVFFVCLSVLFLFLLPSRPLSSPPSLCGAVVTRCRKKGLMSAQDIVVYHIFVHGRVQGVFYRKHTLREAQARGVRGWVHNLPDGRVEVMAEGTKTALEGLLQWCHVGSPKSRVEGVEATLLSTGGAHTFETFEVRR